MSAPFILGLDETLVDCLELVIAEGFSASCCRSVSGRNWIQVTLEFMEDRITELVGLDQERKLVPNLHDIGLRRSVLTSSGHKGSDILNCHFGGLNLQHGNIEIE